MAVGEDEVTTAPRARPSLYAAIKLARLVLFVKERFKARIKSRRPPTEPSIICHRDSLKARAFEDLSHGIRTRSKGSSFMQSPCNYKRETGPVFGLPTLLHDLDSHTLPSDEPLSMVAKNNDLFLKYNAQRIITGNDLDGLRHIVDLTTLLIERLRNSPGSNLARSRNSNSNNSCSGFKCEIFLANLEHLLLSLQQVAYEALIIITLRSIHSDILHWQQYWQERRQTNEGWFAEWPNGQRPLNTTWPWNVKPSLVVLWGVCWMFYGNDDNDFGATQKPRADPNQTFRIRQPSQDLRFMPNVSACLVTTPQASTHIDYTSADVNALLSNTATWNDSQLSTSGIQDTNSWGPLANTISDFGLPGYPSNSIASQYIFTGSAGNSSLFPTQNLPSWPYYQGNRVSASAYQNLGDWPTTIDQQELPNLTTTPQRIQRQGREQPYGFNQNESALNQESRKFETGLSLVVPMRDYPSPHSDASAQVTSYVSPGMQYPPSSGVESPDNEGSIRSGDLVRNDNGQLYCTHNDCASEPPVFPRKCEYTKHMDKHNRPYICEEPGCEKIRGFTYSGGLLRHQREVHGQHGGPKAQCMCPHPDCKRSIGRGFTRKENLFEHLRRVHKPTEASQEPTISAAAPASTIEPGANPSQEGRKRKRLEEEGEDRSGDRDLQKQIKRLRRELQQSNDRLKSLEEIVARSAQGQKNALL